MLLGAGIEYIYNMQPLYKEDNARENLTIDSDDVCIKKV
jgi:hypothetical protein